MPFDMPFSPDLFSALCQAITARGYSTRRFDDASPMRERTFFVRHDVDISPANALLLGEIAAANGVVSNHFFQFNAETYQLFSPENIAIVARLRALGHLVGLHIDQNLTGEDEEKIAATITWFNDTVTPIDRAVSFHRPTPSVVGRRYTAFVNAYDPRFFSADGYMSDSRRSLQFLDKFEAATTEGKPLLQMLLHPEWWTEAASVRDVWQSLTDRRTYELHRYVILNFTKVFADVESPVAHRNFGI